MAAYTGRHLVEIPLSRIRTCDELKRAFYLSSYDTIELDFASKLIVFEDIDCMADVIKKRDPSSALDLVSFVESPQATLTTNGDGVTVQLTESDVETRTKTLSKEFLRDLLGQYTHFNYFSQSISCIDLTPQFPCEH